MASDSNVASRPGISTWLSGIIRQGTPQGRRNSLTSFSVAYGWIQSDKPGFA